MLQKIRDKSGSLIIKIIFAIIGASFVVFGIADVVRILTAIPPVAKIGSLKIGFQDFYETYQKQVAALQRRGIRLSTKHQREQVAKQLLQEMVANRVLEHEPKKQGILVSQDLTMSYLHSLPAFQKDGKFDAEAFRRVVRQVGISPQQLMANLSNDLALQQFLIPMVSGLQMDETYADELVNTFCSKRHFEAVLISQQKADKKLPSDEALEKWMKEHKKKYRRPAQRSVDVILIPHETIEKEAPITEEGLRQSYEERKEEWKVPERREIKAIRFDAESDAIAAKAVLTGKLTEEKVKKLLPGARLFTVHEASLGKEVVDTIHSLQEGENYGPVLRQGKWFIYLVTKVMPASTQSYEEVKTRIEDDLRKAYLLGRLKSIKDKVEDAFGGGQSDEEIAKVVALRRVSFPDLVRDKAEEMLTKGGLTEPVVKAVLAQAFEMEKGEESEFVDVPGYSVMIQIKDVRKKQLPSLKEIREQVAADWKEEADRDKTWEFATTKLGNVETPEEWAKAVKEGGFKVRTLAVSRLDSFEKKAEIYELCDEEVVERILLTKMNTVTFVPTKDNRVMAIFVKKRADDVSLKLEDNKISQVENVKKALLAGFANEAAGLVQGSVVGFYPLKIKKESMKKVLTLSTSN